MEITTRHISRCEALHLNRWNMIVGQHNVGISSTLTVPYYWKDTGGSLVQLLLISNEASCFTCFTWCYIEHNWSQSKTFLTGSPQISMFFVHCPCVWFGNENVFICNLQSDHLRIPATFYWGAQMSCERLLIKSKVRRHGKKIIWFELIFGWGRL